jgi:hypothetical protein
MFRHSFITAAVFVVAWTTMLVAWGDPSQAMPGDAPQTQELTVTGCVTEGTDAGVYILTNAVAKPEMQNIPRAFRLTTDGADLDFTLHTNHQVQTTGRAELKPSPEPNPGGRVDPRDLPAFAVKTIQSVSERCLTGA